MKKKQQEQRPTEHPDHLVRRALPHELALGAAEEDRSSRSSGGSSSSDREVGGCGNSSGCSDSSRIDRTRAERTSDRNEGLCGHLGPAPKGVRGLHGPTHEGACGRDGPALATVEHGDMPTPHEPDEPVGLEE